LISEFPEVPTLKRIYKKKKDRKESIQTKIKTIPLKSNFSYTVLWKTFPIIVLITDLFKLRRVYTIYSKDFNRSNSFLFGVLNSSIINKKKRNNKEMHWEYERKTKPIK
jgi:hypothetical protein